MVREAPLGDGERDVVPLSGVFRVPAAPEMTHPLIHNLAAEGFPVSLTCGVLGFSAQAFYAWSKNLVTFRDLEDAYAINALIDTHSDDPAFVNRFLVDEFERASIKIEERRAWRLCSQ